MLLYSAWLALPIGTRNHIAREFGIVKKGSTEVFNNTIKSDGYVIQDIEHALNKEALRQFTGVHSDDFMVLWDALIGIINGTTQKAEDKPKKRTTKNDVA